MNDLLIYFAFPIATIIISAILQKLLKNPIAVAAFIFAVFLIVTFAAFDETFLIATLIYTILAFITALLTKIAMCLCQLQKNDDDSDDDDDSNGVCETLENIVNNTNNNNSNSSCGCGCNRLRYK